MRQWHPAVAVLISMLTACGMAASDSERVSDAALLMQQGDYRSASIELKSVLRRSPDNADARLKLATIHLGMNDIPSAEKELQRAAELGAAAGPVTALRFDILAAKGEYTEMLAALGMPESELSSADQFRFRGQALLGIRNGEAAEATYREWLEQEPGSADAAVGLAKAEAIQGNGDSAIDRLGAVIDQHPGHADAWLALAVLHYGRGDYEDSRHAYRQSLAARKPQTDIRQTVFALIGLSDTDLLLQDAEAARATIKQLQAFAPSAPHTMLQSARLSQLEQDFPEAARKLQRLNQVLPDNVHVLTLLANVQWRLGNVQQAASHVSRVVTLAPNNLHARKMLAQLQLRQSNTSAALQTLDPLLTLEETDNELFGLLAVADLQSGNPGRAIERLEEAVRLNPDNLDNKLQLAELQVRVGDPSSAIELLGALDFSAGGNFRRERLLLTAFRQTQAIGEADALADRLVAMAPRDPAALNLAADHYMAIGRERDGRNVLERSRDADPNNIDTLLRLAHLEISDEQTETARSLYQSVNRIDENNLAGLIGIARVSIESGDPSAAIQFLELARQKHPLEVLPRVLLARTYYETGDIAAAESEARNLVQLDTDNAALNRAVGRLLMQVGAMEEARAQFEAAVRNDPSSMDALLDLANNLIALDDVRQAAGILEQAIALGPGSRSAQAAMIVVELRLGRINAAADRLTELRQRFPDDPALTILQGEVHFAAGNHRQAAETFNSAIRQGAGFNTVMREFEARRVSGGDAAAPLLGWLESNPDDFRAQTQLAQHYQQMGAGEQAIAVYERLLMSKPENPIFLNNLAWEYHRSGDYERARVLAEKARELRPDSGGIADTLGWIYRSIGDFENSIDHLREAVALQPHNPEFRYHLAAVLADAGNDAEAREILTAIVESDQDFPSISDARALIVQLQ